MKVKPIQNQLEISRYIFYLKKVLILWKKLLLLNTLKINYNLSSIFFQNFCHITVYPIFVFIFVKLRFYVSLMEYNEWIGGNNENFENNGFLTSLVEDDYNPNIQQNKVHYDATQV
jgi:hypothetical protein